MPEMGASPIGAIIWGYDGSDYYRVLVESSTNPNLRVKIYDGATGISATSPGSTNLGGTSAHALDVLSTLYLWDTTAITRPWKTAKALGDNQDGDYFAPVGLYGFDGSTWDRLRTYGTGILKTARAEAGLSCSGVKSADVAIKGSAGKVYWISISDTAALSIELNNSTDGAGTDLWAAVLPANCYAHYIFDPPLEFSTGIYLDVSTATCKVVVGYL